MIALSPQRADPDWWDILSLDGKEFAGYARLEFDRGRDLQDKKVPGEHGEDVDDRGTRSGKIEIVLYTWHVEDYKKNETLLKEFDPPPGRAKAKVISIVHAVPNSRGCDFCIIESIKGPKQEADGFTTWTIKARERLKPNTNNVGIGPPAGQTCDQLRQEYSFRRDDYLTAKYRAQLVVADLANQQRELADHLMGTDDARVLQIENKIRQINAEVNTKLFKLEAVRDRMRIMGCPNLPPGDVGLGIAT